MRTIETLENVTGDHYDIVLSVTGQKRRLQDLLTGNVALRTLIPVSFSKSASTSGAM
jgi:hypothetical protein